MRAARIFLIGTAELFAFLLLRLWLKWVVFGVAALPLALILVGQFYLFRSKQGIRLWMNPDLLEHASGFTLRVSGKSVSLDLFKRWYDIEIEARNLWLLGIIAVASLAATARGWMLGDLIADLPMPGSIWYYMGAAWLIICPLSWRWLRERKAMQGSAFALGNFRVIRPEDIWKRIVYQFIIGNGGYHGGSFRTLVFDSKDDLTVVFYPPSDPDVSVPASAMMFHRLKWADLKKAPD